MNQFIDANLIRIDDILRYRQELGVEDQTDTNNQFSHTKVLSQDMFSFLTRFSHDCPITKDCAYKLYLPENGLTDKN